MSAFKGDKLFILILKKSLNMLMDNDRRLIKRDLHEDCISHRLAVYLSKNIYMINEFISVDVQYNRNRDHPKYQNNSNIKMIPDILIHKRESNDRNIAAFENKKIRLDDRDKEKLIQLLNEDYEYRYEYCCSILYKPEENYMKILIMRDDKYYILNYDKQSYELVIDEENTYSGEVPDSFV